MNVLLPALFQRASGSGGGDGVGHRHVLPLPADQRDEKPPAAT